MHWNGLSGMYIGFKVCHIQWHWFWAVLPGQKHPSLCIFMNKYGLQIGNAMEKINSVLTRKKCSKWLDTPCIEIFGHANSNGTGFETVHSGIYVCIILVAAHRKTILVTFCNIIQKTTEENTHKMFHISPLIVLFSYGKVKDIFGIRIKFHYKVRWKLYLPNCWSDKLLITAIVISMTKNLYARALKWFWAVLPGPESIVCVLLRNKCGFQIGYAMEKYKMLQTGSVIAPGVQIYKSEADSRSGFKIWHIITQ